ncbi:hypothetical protein LEMLEM_LOCUS2304 [Lemmus lemmus]
MGLWARLAFSSATRLMPSPRNTSPLCSTIIAPRVQLMGAQ